MSYGRHPYYIFADTEYLHVWADAISEPHRKPLASPIPYSSSDFRDEMVRPAEMILIPRAAIHQFLHEWVRSHPYAQRHDLLAFIDEDFGPKEEGV